VSTAGAIALVIEYYQNGKARPVSDPLPTVTCKSRFGLAQASGGVVCFRMLQPHELAAAQGFPRGYKFSGRKAEQVKQIGNAVPCGLSRALVLAQLSQNPRAAVKGVAQ
jgi:DNA (cytosine-5)-methyltransferase 1